MTKMTKEQLQAQAHEWSAKLAVEGTLEWFDTAIRNYEAGVRELRRYRERFVEAVAKPEQGATPVSVLSWAVNEIQNIDRNIRLDMVANHAAALALTQRKEP